MSWLEAVLLGVVQGLTEFLPISSSGHLIIVPWLQSYDFLLNHPSFNKTFDVALHAGTLIAAIGYFHREVVDFTKGFFTSIWKRRIETTNERLAWAIAIGTVPAVIAGALFADFIDNTLGAPWMIAIQLIVFGAILLWADKLPQKRDLDSTSLKDGLIIGASQILALAPGTSRSGITITFGRWLGLDRDAAARISFLLLIPVVFGATVYEALQISQDGLPNGVVVPMIVGFIAAAISGYIAIAFLLRLVRTHSYRPFVYYRYALGVAILLIIATGIRPATFG